MPEDEQKPAVLIALEMCEIIGTEPPSSEKAFKILGLLAEANELDTEYLGDASGLAMAIKAAATGVARDFAQGVDMHDEGNREYYGELMCAIVAIADKTTDIIDRNTGFALLESEAMSAGNVTRH